MYMINLNKQRRFLILLCASVFALMNVSAQDNNYWNLMPGSRSSVMGGAVVGGVRDNSAIFYNPGALGFVDSNTISVNASLYNYEHEKIVNGGGTGVTFTSGLFLPIPLLQISGIIRIKNKPRHTLGFMIFTKNQTSNNFSYRNDTSLPSSTLLAGDGYTATNPNVEYIGEYNLKTTLNEMWVGLSYSYKINSHISIGASPFFAYRTQTLTSSFVARTFADSSSNYYNLSQDNIPTWSYNDNENITFSNLRALGKIGVDFDYGNLKVGAAFTTPSVSLFGTAIIERDIAYGGNSIDTVNGNPFINPTSFNYNDRQQGLKTTYKSPWSASVGIDYTIKKTGTTIAFTGEYFGAIAPYDLATPKSQAFQRPVWYNGSLPTYYQANSDEYLRIMEASQGVANFAIAVYQVVSRKIDIAASFRSDFTSYKKAANDFWEYQYVDTTLPQGQRLSFSNINLYHLTVGIIIKNKKSDLYLGVNYTFGANKSFQPMNDIANPGDNTNNLGAVAANNAPNFYYPYGTTGQYTPLATYKYSSYSLIVGYTHHFN